MQFEAHPGEPLKDHLEAVGTKSKEIIKRKSLSSQLDGEFLSNISFLIGISHDFGKFTTFFQDKLKTGIDSRSAHHGLISAFFGYESLSKYLVVEGKENHDVYKHLPIIGYLVIKRHHGNLESVLDSVDSEKLYEEFCNMPLQVEDIQKNLSQIEAVYKDLLKNFNLDFADVFEVLCGRYKETTNEIDKMIDPLISAGDYFDCDNRSIVFFLLTQLLYSVLIDSDKKHAGKVSPIERREIPPNIVDRYKERPDFKKDNVSNINEIRDEIYKSVVKRIKGNKDKKIFSITAPTGTGKTLTSLSAALKLRDLTKESSDGKYVPRIIYSLPFTSIIDQNFDVFDDMLEKTVLEFKENESLYLIKHHHLAEMVYKQGGVDKPIDESLALVETWESEIIVTTFIQFFYSVIGYKNRFLKKFHNIAGSIIILDEVQNIPIRYWKLVREVLVAMTECFNCRVILLTATKPLIFEEAECVELVESHEKYFMKDELNRVNLLIDHNKKSISDFAREVDNWSKNSYMFVFNTIGSSLEFYNHLVTMREGGEGLSEFELIYLSTNIVPKERRERIKKIKKLTEKKKKVIIVTTQLIEAGVDIDVEVMYRDIGPLDSIIQVAGRCNRKKMIDVGEVHVISLINENHNDKLFSSYIYDPTLLFITKEVFKEKTSVPESEFLSLINKYFTDARSKSAEDSKIISAAHRLYYADKNYDRNKRVPVSDFKLIDDQGKIVDVFFELQKYLFSWGDIPGNDSGRLRDFLTDTLEISWAKNPEIKKSDDNKTITVTQGENSLALKLNKEKNIVTIETGGGKTREYVLKEENGKLNIYDKEATDVWKEYTKILNEEYSDPYKKKNELRRIRKKFYNYVISIYENYSGCLGEKIGGIYYVPSNELENYYNTKTNTGFKREDAGSGTLFG